MDNQQQRAWSALWEDRRDDMLHGASLWDGQGAVDTAEFGFQWSAGGDCF